ncbi:MAG: nuclear transport factor 2 family protein [Verrucomicrobia bacterium]|nr:nuclear transport factor 2 family protein [Verrucomicrobiota bacterium]
MQNSPFSDKSETPNLPEPIAAYFTADKGLDGKAVSQCFTENAIVKDESHTYSGRAEILQWQEVTTSKYQYTSEPFACEKPDREIIVTSHLTGNFPGSPVDLRYFFKLEGDKISSLEIIP